MQGDDPPYLPVGTAVSAKYKGAFCEAKVSKVVRCVKCKITYKMGLGQATVTDEQIRGPLRVGHTVQARHSEKKEFIEATISKIQDCSQYTVVFDDGDITTLRRTALCLKSGRHFNESETLDQLPLTHPEHFGNPVVGGRRGRRSRQLKEDSSEGEPEGEENEPDLVLYSSDIGKVVCVEGNDKKKSRDNWFPGLVVVPSAQPTVRINVREEYLVRSFKDGRYYTVPKKEISEFSRDLGNRIENAALSEAMDKAIKYLDRDELPVHWERATLFDLHIPDSDSDENYSDSSDDEPREEKDHFVAQLYKFMDDRGTPLNKSPMISNRDVDLYRLFRVVHKLGGYNRVTNQSKWRSVAIRLGYQHNHATYNSVKQFYKKYLFSFEEFYRKLGCTMINHPRNAKKHRGRSLIRDRDRATPVNSSPRPERSDESVSESSDNKKEEVVPKSLAETPTKAAKANKKEIKIELSDSSNEGTSTTSSSSEVQSVFQNITVESTTSSSSSNKKKATSTVVVAGAAEASTATSTAVVTLALTPAKAAKERKVKAATGDKVKALVEHFEEQSKKEAAKEEEKTQPPAAVQVQQQTRSKSSQSGPKVKEKEVVAAAAAASSAVATEKTKETGGLRSKVVPKKAEEDKQRRGRKRKDTTTETEANKPTQESSSGSSGGATATAPSVEPTAAPPVAAPTAATAVVTMPQQIVNIGDKLKVYYGPTHESKVTYEAKVLDMNRNTSGIIYRVHYTGWNTRYDEWIKPARIAENLSTATKAKRLKQQAQTGKVTPTKPAAKRGRGTSVSSRSQEPSPLPPPPPRSTTPSSVTSSSSRTKSPATPAGSKAARVTRGAGAADNAAPRRTRRTSVVHSGESDTDSEQSESEISRTRSGGGKSTEETTRRKLTAKRKDEENNDDDDDTEKEEEEEEDDDDEKEEPPKRTASKRKKESSVVESDDDEDSSSSPPKGRDFDLNQIRSELKGFEKAVKITSSTEAAESTLDEVTAAKGGGTVDATERNESDTKGADEKPDKVCEKNTDDIYEFKEPEPFEFEARATTKLSEEKGTKKRLVSRLFDDLEAAKSPPKKKGGAKSPPKNEATPPAKDEEKKLRTFGKRTPSKAAAAKQIVVEEAEKEKTNVKEETTPVKVCDDLFDKLVESPSFNLNASLLSGGDTAAKPKVVKMLNMDESVSSLCRDLPEQPSITVKKKEEEEEVVVGCSSRGLLELYDDADDDIPIAEVLFMSKEALFTETKRSSKPEATNPIIFCGFNKGDDTTDESKEQRLKMSDEDDLIKAAIQRAISNTMTDEDSAEDDLFMAQSAQSAQMFPTTKINTIQGAKLKPLLKDELMTDSLAEDLKEPLSINTAETALVLKEDSSSPKELKAKQISPALQETDSSVLEAISLQTEMLKKEEPREAHIKTGGTKIADSILQKFNMIKKNEEVKSPPPPLPPVKMEQEEEEKEKKIKVESVVAAAIKIQSSPPTTTTTTTTTTQPASDDFHLETNKKRSSKKVVSREFIEESDSDSTDSEERLVIARSDDDSQTNPCSDRLDFKDTDNSDSIQAAITDDSLEEAAAAKLVIPDKDNGDLETTLQTAATVKLEKEEGNANVAAAAVKSEPEESESSISLLLCKETIPGSPAPVTEMSPAAAEPRAKPKSAKSLLLEMPFASAPGTSKGMLSSSCAQEMAPTAKQQPVISGAANVNPSNKQEAQPLAVPLEQQQIQVASVASSSNNVVIETEHININNNTSGGGGTTPESTISNLSPNMDRVSPNNDSCKSTDLGRNNHPPKGAARYVCEEEEEEEEEEETLLSTEPSPTAPSVAKKREEMTSSGGAAAAPCRKRRRSCKGDEVPAKRGRKANVRNLRANSDSDDTSEHSAPGSTPPAISSEAARISITSRSPRPSKFNFIIELDSSMDSSQRISVLTHKLSELRKTYNNVKTELACIDRRRKKLRRREREALKASKQELACS